MIAGDGIESRVSSRSGPEASAANPALRSVVLNLCTRHGARRILCIGRGGETLGLALQQAGYTVLGMDPGEHRATDLAECTPPSHPCETGMDPDPPLGEQGRFDIAISTESPEPCSELGERVQLAAHQLQPGGLFLLPTPYRSSLKSRVVALCDRWQRLHGRSHHDPSWSKPHVKRLLASHGFILSELIGVRDASGPLKTVVWVARQGGRPQAAGGGGRSDSGRRTPPQRHGMAPERNG